MLRPALQLVLLVSCAAATAAAQDSLRWGPAPASLPSTALMAIMRGDPAKPGPFVVRFQLPDDFTVPPHYHPVDEHQTLISGQIGHGMGDTVNLKAVRWLRPGQSITLPANSHHYVQTRGLTVVEVSAMGPFRVTYVEQKR
jgi:quercetin dioxygenase-like cupin family protein